MTRRVRVRVRMWTFVAMFSQGFFLYIAVQDLSDWTWGSMAWCWSSVRISRLWNYQHHPCQHHNHCHHHIHHWHTKLFTVIDSNLSIDLDDFPVLLVAVVLSGVATTFYTMRQVCFYMIWWRSGRRQILDDQFGQSMREPYHCCKAWNLWIGIYNGEMVFNR